ncbi:MAG TPA: chemotaxis protein CheW [Candidatus Acidoferrales bacterium]|nr:chemotaxis protein CheW [Candidatus Acidoferrales bacterium]
MSPAAAETQLKSFVLVPMGSRKMALAAESVIELVASSQEQGIPHRTPWLSGVIVRRGRVVPVCDVRRLLGEEASHTGGFHLIVESQVMGTRDWYAIPVVGECMLATAETTLPAQDCAEHVVGILPIGDENVEILDFGKLIQEQELAFVSGSTEPSS